MLKATHPIPNLSQTHLRPLSPDIREVEDEVGEIDEFFDFSETRTPHALPTPGGMKEFLQSNPISIQITSFGNH